MRRAPRVLVWLIVAAVLLAMMGALSPVQLPVVLYKAALISLAAVLGWWLDRSLFPYSRPDGYLVRDWRGVAGDTPDGKVDYPIVPEYRWVFAVALLRRAIVVGAVVIGVALGL
jgi:hypothetical protein